MWQQSKGGEDERDLIHKLGFDLLCASVEGELDLRDVLEACHEAVVEDAEVRKRLRLGVSRLALLQGTS